MKILPQLNRRSREKIVQMIKGDNVKQLPEDITGLNEEIRQEDLSEHNSEFDKYLSLNVGCNFYDEQF